MQRPSFTSFAALLALVISLANAFNQTGYAQGGSQTVGRAFTYQGRLDSTYSCHVASFPIPGVS
ncbi:hypothetical protein [Chloroflexus sp.]|uniref:hypothetical protein n=1 Tax=Chloroflexus sp. TaxID=1904827 RepID=UPI002ACDD572|nr:hypothetical protein [Chloroflexus sp.]